MSPEAARSGSMGGEAGKGGGGTAGGDYAIVIPAFRPGEGLPGYVAALRAASGAPIVIVDDGSGEGAREIFRRCGETAGVEVLHHEANRGKGRALKTAFGHLLETRPGLAGCVTCDSDGQHAPEDVVKCLEVLAENPGDVALGCRTFHLAHVPWKSRWGNNAMRALFRLVTGRKLRDTQTGLRALPAEFMREMLECPGERFDFETHMLLRLGGRRVVQVPIRTLYDEGNRGTHFDPFGDSARIVSILLAEGGKKLATFTLASVLSFAVDIGLFSLLYYRIFGEGARGRLFLSVALARAVSLVFNYVCNRRFVFGDAMGGRRFDLGAFARYGVLAAGIMGASYVLTGFFHAVGPWVPLPWVKAGVDAGLFLASYVFQRLAVFRHRDA